MPDLIGKTVEDAEAALAEVGLKLEVIGETPVTEEEELEGLVATQEFEAGTLLDDGTTIQVTIGVIIPPPTEPPEEP